MRFRILSIDKLDFCLQTNVSSDQIENCIYLKNDQLHFQIEQKSFANRYCYFELKRKRKKCNVSENVSIKVKMTDISLVAFFGLDICHFATCFWLCCHTQFNFIECCFFPIVLNRCLPENFKVLIRFFSI